MLHKRITIRECGCEELIKAIDRYIAKINDDLEEQMSEAGYADAEDSVSSASDLEEEISEVLHEQTDEIVDKIQGAGSLEEAKDLIEEYFANDILTKNALTTIFEEYFYVVIPSLAESYIKQTAGDMVISDIRHRTSAWIDSWSDELSEIMQLTSHDDIGSLIQTAINNGDSVDDLSLMLMENGIRNEEWRARRAALTEMLRAHSVAQQEAMTQSPVVDRKMWRHSGSYKSKPRENHVAMDGQVVDKDQPYELHGADGSTYYPMYPRDSSLPPRESVNCGCISQPIVDDDILGMSLEERQRMQQEIIDSDNGEWEKELDDSNMARAGIEGYEEPSQERAIRHTNTKAAEKWAKTHLGVTKTNYKNQDIVCVNKANRALQRIYREYPELNGFVQEISFSDELPINMVAAASISKTKKGFNTKLKLNKNYFLNAKALKEFIKQQVSGGQWTSKRGIYGVIKHEMTHMLSYKYSIEHTSSIDAAWNDIDKPESDMCSEVKRKALEACNLSDDDDIIKTNLSELAAVNAEEFVAEAISCSKNSKLVKVVRQLFDENVR